MTDGSSRCTVQQTANTPVFVSADAGWNENDKKQ